MNQNYGTTGIKHTMAMLLMMALADENHQHLNIGYVASQPTPLEVSTAAEAKWLRDLILVVDPKVYEQIRSLINGSMAVPGGIVDAQLFQDTAKNINLILRGVSESYHATYAVTAGDGLTLWDPSCFPHPAIWRVREAVGALLA